MQNKVVLEITGNDCKTTIWYNGGKYCITEGKTKNGSRCVSDDCLEDLDLPDVLYDALDSTFGFEVMWALSQLEESEVEHK